MRNGARARRLPACEASCEVVGESVAEGGWRGVAARAIPAGDPVDGAENGERRELGVDLASALPALGPRDQLAQRALVAVAARDHFALQLRLEGRHFECERRALQRL